MPDEQAQQTTEPKEPRSQRAPGAQKEAGAELAVPRGADDGGRKAGGALVAPVKTNLMFKPVKKKISFELPEQDIHLMPQPLPPGIHDAFYDSGGQAAALEPYLTKHDGTMMKIQVKQSIAAGRDSRFPQNLQVSPLCGDAAFTWPVPNDYARLGGANDEASQ